MSLQVFSRNSRPVVNLMDNVTTSASGTVFVALASHSCHSVVVYNSSGTAISIQRVSNSASSVSIAIGASATFYLNTGNSNELGAKRTDGSVTQVTLGYECLTFDAPI